MEAFPHPCLQPAAHQTWNLYEKRRLGDLLRLDALSQDALILQPRGLVMTFVYTELSVENGRYAPLVMP
jgi:hypothetical protein